MKETELVKSVSFTTRPVLKRWIAGFKQVKSIPPETQLKEKLIHLFVLWVLDTQGCPPNLRRALTAIKDEWQNEAELTVHTQSINELHQLRRDHGLPDLQ